MSHELTRLALACCVAMSVVPSVANAQGSIKGRVTDSNGLVCPGADVTASMGGVVRGRAVSDSSGLYTVASLPAGTYAVAVALVPFLGEHRESIAVVNDLATDGIDFVLCSMGHTELDWPVPQTVEEMWKQADLVARIRIVATSKIRPDCPSSGWRQEAAVIEVFKGSNTEKLTFLQEQWARERVPYGVSQELVVFLRGSTSRWLRLAGPYCVFRIDGTAVRSGHPGIQAEHVSAQEFLDRLRLLSSDPSKRRDKRNNRTRHGA